jgi:dienelactone hydrolase
MVQKLSYRVGQQAFEALLAQPHTACRAAVLVFHGGSGLGEHERLLLARLSALGYAACATDMFGEPFRDRAHGMQLIGALVSDAARLRARTAAALACLCAQPGIDAARVAAIGNCFGGLCALELARSGAAIAAAVSLHGGLSTGAPARRGEVQARVLACSGAADPFCPREQRSAFEDELTAAGVDWQHHVYGGVQHGFTLPNIDPSTFPGCAYDARADARAWAAMHALFDEVF